MVGVNRGPDHALAQRLKDLETQVRQLQQRPALQNASTTQSDGTVGAQFGTNADGTAFLLLRHGLGTPTDPETGQHPPFMYAGEVVVGAVNTGAGLLLKRPDGTAMFAALRRTVATGHVVELYDTAGDTVVGADALSGFGLSAPWVPFPTPQNTNVATWPSTSASAWTTVATSNGYLQHPKVRWNGYGHVSAGTAQFQLLIGGVAYGSPVTADASVNGGFAPIAQDLTVPASVGWLAGVELDVQARVTSGSGTASVQTYGIYGRQS